MKSANRLREACGKDGAVTVDLSDLRHFDLSFLGLLLTARTAQNRRGFELRITGLTPAFERVLAWAGYP